MASSHSVPVTRFKLVFYAPGSAVDACQNAVFAAGAGRNSSGKHAEECWFVMVNSQFRPVVATNPIVGSVVKMQRRQEVRVEVICFGEDIARKAVEALKGSVDIYLFVLFITLRLR